MRMYSWANADKKPGYNRKWQEKHPEQYREMRRKYNNSPENKILYRMYGMIYNWAFPEKNREKSRIYKKRHPDRNRASSMARHAKKMGAVPNGTDMREINKIYTRAHELKQWFNVEVDHIIPLSKGGLHCPDNLQIIYRSENCRKNNRVDYSPSVIFQ